MIGEPQLGKTRLYRRQATKSRLKPSEVQVLLKLLAKLGRFCPTLVLRTNLIRNPGCEFYKFTGTIFELRICIHLLYKIWCRQIPQICWLTPSDPRALHLFRVAFVVYRTTLWKRCSFSLWLIFIVDFALIQHVYQCMWLACVCCSVVWFAIAAGCLWVKRVIRDGAVCGRSRLFKVFSNTCCCWCLFFFGKCDRPPRYQWPHGTIAYTNTPILVPTS